MSNPESQYRKTAEILKFLKERAIKEHSLTNFHLNDTFLDFWDCFFKDNKDVNKVKGKFRYYCNLLVKEGFLQPAKRVPIGPGGYNEFGVRTVTNWGLRFKEGHEDVQD